MTFVCSFTLGSRFMLQKPFLHISRDMRIPSAFTGLSEAQRQHEGADVWHRDFQHLSTSGSLCESLMWGLIKRSAIHGMTIRWKTTTKPRIRPTKITHGHLGPRNIDQPPCPHSKASTQAPSRHACLVACCHVVGIASPRQARESLQQGVADWQAVFSSFPPCSCLHFGAAQALWRLQRQRPYPANLPSTQHCAERGAANVMQTTAPGA